MHRVPLFLKQLMALRSSSELPLRHPKLYGEKGLCCGSTGSMEQLAMHTLCKIQL